MMQALCIAYGRMRQNRKVQMCLSLRNRYVFPWIFLTVFLLGLQKFKHETILAEIRPKCLQANDVQFVKAQSNAVISTTTATVDNSESALFPFHPFVAGQSKIVVVLSYQRCGSSFFSDMFNRNPKVFYFFEPIDSIYSAIYGTELGWNVPSDITGQRNGTERLQTDVEIDEVSRFLISLLTCRVDELPMETLAHRFLYNDGYQEPNPYVQCISSKALRDAAERCFALAPISFCGRRFGATSDQRHDECYRLLSDPDLLRKHPNRSLFVPYVACRKRTRQTFLDSCGRLLSKTCSERPIRAVKTVRASMESMEPLLTTLPNFRLIHLLRDPRAVMLSRKWFDGSAKTLYSVDRDLFVTASEARLFCQTVTRDIQVRMDLERRFPGRIYTVFYEDAMEQLKTTTSNIYTFLDASSPIATTWWRRKVWAQYTVEASRKIAYNWRTNLTFRENKDIVDNCAELFDLVGSKWER